MSCISVNIDDIDKNDFPNQLLEVFNRIRAKERKLKLKKIYDL